MGKALCKDTKKRDEQKQIISSYKNVRNFCNHNNNKNNNLNINHNNKRMPHTVGQGWPLDILHYVAQ